jgi:DNA-binding NarL/FixJ family response regulator
MMMYARLPPPFMHTAALVRSAATVAITARNHAVMNGIALYCLSSAAYRVVSLTRSPQFLLQSMKVSPPDVDDVDIVVFHCTLTDSESVDSIQQFRQAFPTTKIVVLGDYIAPSLVNLVFQYGANGYLLTMPLKHQLLETLEFVCMGRQVLDKQLSHLLPALDLHDVMILV